MSGCYLCRELAPGLDVLQYQSSTGRGRACPDTLPLVPNIFYVILAKKAKILMETYHKDRCKCLLMVAE
ncbi:hypothetical protein Y1Q_0003167 [Alligator mississippiensis]|uniref:Uncharacterized protein n=1 Tax=Alligator mississippiensis TaxID=8496 RepID=A0A151MDQ9_ALLMI|nr:hypothetical protein Y1Q_0003167 [Alligator mississippiensis]